MAKVEHDPKLLNYSAPKLVIYGEMVSLTAAGSGQRTENKPNRGNGPRNKKS